MACKRNRPGANETRNSRSNAAGIDERERERERSVVYTPCFGIKLQFPADLFSLVEVPNAQSVLEWEGIFKIG